MDTAPIGRPTIKAALLLGFGLTLALWLWTGYDFTRRMSMVQEEAAAISLRYLQAQELLAEVRPQVLSMSINLRTALLAPDHVRRAAVRQRIRRSVETVDEALERYVPVLNSDVERGRVGRLRREVGSFGLALDEILKGELSLTAAEGWDVLNRVTPQREMVIGITDEVQTLNRAAFVEQQTAIAETYRQSQRRVWERLGLSLIASLAIACLATLYAGRLENRLRRQREREIQHTRDLQQLSSRLVDAQEQERRVIARELHDELGQVLMAVKVELTLAEHKLQATGVETMLRDAQSITQRALDSVRDLSHGLHPAVLDDLGLAAALDCYLVAIARHHSIRVVFDHSGITQRFPPSIELAAYRIVQEAVTNTVKHAAAATCTVTVRGEAAHLSVTVEDDGRGFDAREVDVAGGAAGLGLIGIRERVVQLRGTMRVASTRHKGTVIAADLPTEAFDLPVNLSPDARFLEAMSAERADG